MNPLGLCVCEVMCVSLTHHLACVVCESSAEWGCVCSVVICCSEGAAPKSCLFECSRWCYHEGIVISTSSAVFY